MSSLVLVSNPGSASRKYAVYKDSACLARVHFEKTETKIVYSLEFNERNVEQQPINISNLAFAATKLPEILGSEIKPEAIAFRVVAPSSFFQQDRPLDKTSSTKLRELEAKAPLHINGLLTEIELLAKTYPSAKLLGISDSAFHSTKSEVATDYAIPPADAKKLDIRRFGYHGLAVESVVTKLTEANKLASRVVVCHLGSGASVTAVRYGRSIDNSMGYSPESGLMMATRAGDLDIAAALALKSGLKFDDEKLETYLNRQSGLLGVSGTSSDIRQLLALEKNGHNRAKQALSMYIQHIIQMVGQMTASLGGLDGLAFSGTVAERNAEIRRRIIQRMHYLGLALDSKANHHLPDDKKVKLISPAQRPAKIYVVPIDEAEVMASHAAKLIG